MHVRTYRLIEETQEDVEATQSKLEDTTKRINKFIEENGTFR